MDYSIIENLAVAFIQTSRGQCHFMKCLGVSFRKISREVSVFYLPKKMTENRAWIHSKETVKKILC